MKKLTTTFSINQKPKPDDLIVSINSNKEILFNKKTKTFFHVMPKEHKKAYKIFEQNDFSIDICFNSRWIGFINKNFVQEQAIS